jgi:hypothetical protein
MSYEAVKPNHSMQRTALRAAADAGRSALSERRDNDANHDAGF